MGAGKKQIASRLRWEINLQQGEDPGAFSTIEVFILNGDSILPCTPIL